jgi:hypothetical protein
MVRGPLASSLDSRTSVRKHPLASPCHQATWPAITRIRPGAEPRARGRYARFRCLARGSSCALNAGEEVTGRIIWQQAVTLSRDPSPRQFDLVLAQFMHRPRLAREALHRRLATGI